MISAFNWSAIRFFFLFSSSPPPRNRLPRIALSPETNAPAGDGDGKDDGEGDRAESDGDGKDDGKGEDGKDDGEGERTESDGDGKGDDQKAKKSKGFKRKVKNRRRRTVATSEADRSFIAMLASVYIRPDQVILTDCIDTCKLIIKKKKKN